MYGTITGNLLGLFLYLLFQLFGIVISFGFVKSIKRKDLALLIGSVLGSCMFMWLPILFAFFVDFTVLAHILATGLAFIIALNIFIFRNVSFDIPKFKINLPIGIFSASIFLIFSYLIIHGFRYEDGIIYSSQCTYGDMSMHLSFITSIASQGSFPPYYSLLPDTMLSYPFLSDSISSSFYVLGGSLIFSYLVPMFFAMAQVLGGFYLLMKLWLKDSKKVLVSMILFFLNGGLGFIYFIDGLGSDTSNFTRIFTDFYTTPTNYVEENIRFVNVIVDMLVPQRATLFGWAVLFTCLALLYYARENQNKTAFIFTGILAGALPMIHTHSFLALAMVSFFWILGDLIENKNILKILLISFIPVMTIIQFITITNTDIYFYLAISVVLIFVVLAVVLIIKNKYDIKNWLIYLGITLVLALPQLLFWTFSQVQGETFLRGHFNWGNLDDNYLWFYIKNVGIVALLFIPAILNSKKSILKTVFPVVFIMYICELMVFQPNTYDNNKLIYVGYALCTGMVADYLVDCYRKLKGIKGRKILAIFLCLLCTVSAVLTICREWVASYQLYSEAHVESSEYIIENIPEESTFLTYNNHNNALVSLTGRNIVCGSSSYLYFHGLDYYERESNLSQMYEYPLDNLDLFLEYQVDYIMVSDYEINNYNVNMEEIEQISTLIYDNGTVKIYEMLN